MIYELSFLVYGGQPQNMLHSSSDVGSEERQAMMRWCRNLKEGNGKYDEFITEGGISWIDVPTSSGRRLFVRVFATQGETRDCWYFLGFLLSKSDYEAIGDYGSLVGFAESFSLESVPFDRTGKSRLAADFDQSSVASRKLPPLFDESKENDWLDSPWIESRVKKKEHIQGKGLYIAFNPPKVKSEFTTLLLSDGFPMPGLKLVPKSDDSAGKEVASEKKKRLAKQTPLLLASLLVPLFAIGYLLGSSMPKGESTIASTVTLNDENHLVPTIRLPRKLGLSFTFVIEGKDVRVSELVVNSNDEWIKVGSPERKERPGIVYPCNVKLPENSSVNKVLKGSLVSTYDGVTVAEHRIEVESAEIIVSLSHDFKRNGLGDIADDQILRGFVSTRYGVASVVVNNVPAELHLVANGNAGEWSVVPENRPETLHIVVTDQNGNELSTTETFRNR